MESYRSLLAWQRAHRLCIEVLRATDAAYHPRAKTVFDQLRRAAVSVEANIVEGYALQTPGQFRRHLRIAAGSAAEAECLLRTAGELQYLPGDVVERLTVAIDEVFPALVGLLRRYSRG